MYNKYGTEDASGIIITITFQRFMLNSFFPQRVKYDKFSNRLNVTCSGKQISCGGYKEIRTENKKM